MILSAVTVSLVAEARGGPFVFWDDLPAACRKAKSLGFDAIEVFPPGPETVEGNVRNSSTTMAWPWRPWARARDGLSTG